MALHKNVNVLLVVVEVAKMLKLCDRQHGNIPPKLSNDANELQLSIKFDLFSHTSQEIAA